jgi:hypothetical protein
MDIMSRLESVGTPGGNPSEPVLITDSGLLADDAAVEAVIDENKALRMAKMDV